MAGFFQQFAKDAAGGFFGSDYLRDYTHASKTFRPNAYQYAPKFKFLFHVYFDINQNAYSKGLSTGANFGLAVKSVKLPSYNFTTHEMNQYNRKRIVQSKIKYDPIDINFHDDNGNLIRDMWYNYYTYYYKDATKPITLSAGRQTQQQTTVPNNAGATNYNERNLYKPSITGDDDWGYIGETSSTVQTNTQAAIGATKVPFFKNITVFGFNQHNFVAYTLINPIITRFSHDTYDYAQGNGTMENQMTIDYETVKYFDGKIDGRSPGNIVKGFGEEANYDRTLSPIARAGSQGTILGQGGLVDGVGGAIEDLANGNILGAIQKGGVTYNTFKNINLKQLAKSEVLAAATNSIQQTPNRNLNFQFPAFGQTTNLFGTAGSPVNAKQNPTVIINNIPGNGV